MTRRAATSLTITALLLSGCGDRFSDSGWNPFGWFDGASGPTTLEPDRGYAAKEASRPLIPRITSARWEGIGEGRMLVVTGIAPTKGYHSAELIPLRPQPRGRIAVGPDGVLQLQFVAFPPPPGTEAARLPTNPETDAITTAMAFSHTRLANFTRVEIIGGSNSVTLGK